MKFFPIHRRQLSLFSLAMAALFCLGSAPGCALYDGLSGESDESDPDTSAVQDAARDSDSPGDAAKDVGVDADSATEDADADADAESDAESPRCPWECGAGVCGEHENECHYPRTLSVGGDHACAIFTDDKIRCWGKNDMGQLGRETIGDFSPIAQIVDFGDVALVPIAIAAGGTHSCAILGDLSTQQVYCWGGNNKGQLGSDISGKSAKPTSIIWDGNFSERRYTAIVAGAEHSCLVSETDGFVVCWGNNAESQVGNADPSGSIVRHPQVWVRDESAAASHRDVSFISTHANHTCTIDEENTLRCWGSNQSGQLGERQTDEQNYHAMPVNWQDANLTSRYVLIVAAGGQHTCALVKSDALSGLYCWGDNSLNQSNPAADNTSPGSETPTRVVVVGSITNISAISAGDAFTCFVAGEDKHIRCFGDSSRAQTGKASITNPKIGENIHTKFTADLTGVDAIDAGASHTCALRENDGGHPEVWCWGDNTYGQLGVSRQRTSDDCESADYCSKKAVLVRF